MSYNNNQGVTIHSKQSAESAGAWNNFYENRGIFTNTEYFKKFPDCEGAVQQFKGQRILFDELRGICPSKDVFTKAYKAYMKRMHPKVEVPDDLDLDKVENW